MTHATNPTLIERAAEAMWTLDRKVKGDRWDTAKDRVRDEYRDLARAALSIPEAGEEAVRAEREAIADMADQYAMNIRSQICKVSESDTVNCIDASAKWNRATALEDFAFCVRARTKDEAND
jgi:hypothetical protein